MLDVPGCSGNVALTVPNPTLSLIIPCMEPENPNNTPTGWVAPITCWFNRGAILRSMGQPSADQRWAKSSSDSLREPSSMIDMLRQFY